MYTPQRSAQIKANGARPLPPKEPQPQPPKQAQPQPPRVDLQGYIPPEKRVSFQDSARNCQNSIQVQQQSQNDTWQFRMARLFTRKTSSHHQRPPNSKPQGSVKPQPPNKGVSERKLPNGPPPNQGSYRHRRVSPPKQGAYGRRPVSPPKQGGPGPRSVSPTRAGARVQRQPASASHRHALVGAQPPQPSGPQAQRGAQPAYNKSSLKNKRPSVINPVTTMAVMTYQEPLMFTTTCGNSQAMGNTMVTGSNECRSLALIPNQDRPIVTATMDGGCLATDNTLDKRLKGDSFTMTTSTEESPIVITLGHAALTTDVDKSPGNKQVSVETPPSLTTTIYPTTVSTSGSANYTGTCLLELY